MEGRKEARKVVSENTQETDRALLTSNSVFDLIDTKTVLRLGTGRGEGFVGNSISE